MRLERTQNAIQGIWWGTVSKVITLFLPFLIRTLVIYIFGVEYAGLNGLFSSILQVLSLAELGMSTAIVYSMYKPIAENDYESLSALLNYFKKVYRIIGIVVLAIGIAIVPFLDKLINGSCPDNINLYLIYFIYLLNTATSYLFFAYRTTLLNAYQRIDVISKINTVVHLLQNISQLIVILMIKNFYIYLAITIVFTTLNNYWCSKKTKILFPEIKCQGKISKDQRNTINTSIKGLVISKVCQVSRNSFDTICTSAFIGLTATTIYSNYYYLLSTITGLLTVILNSISAGIGNSITVESVEKNYDDMNKLNFLYMWIAGWCTCCFFCLYQPFMIIWVGKELTLPFGCMVLFCLYFFLLCMGDIRAQYFNANGLWWKGKWVAILESICNIILNVVLGYFFHIWGILIATLLTVLLINHVGNASILFKYYFRKFSLFRYFGVCFFYFLVTAIACIITYGICAVIPFKGVVGLIVDFLICCLVPNLFFTIIYHKTKYFPSCKEYVKTIFLKIRMKLLKKQ